jgi:cell division septation protein DedD
MTDSAEQLSEIDKLRAFEQRMHAEGAAGFANGLEPWNDWRETDNTDSGRNWGYERQPDDTPVGKTLCEKLLPTMATLAVATLAVGIGGVYMSAQNSPLVAANDLQPAPASTMVAAIDPPPTGTVIRSTPASPGPADKTVPDSHVAANITPDDAADLIDALAPPGMPLGTTGRTRANPTVTAAAAGHAIPPEDPSPAIAGLASTPVNRLPAVARLAPEPDSPLSASDITTTLPAPAAGIPAPAAPTTLSMATPSIAVVPPATRTAAAKAVDGAWVVNISSYRFESMANRKLAEFRKKGVDAEIYPVTIKGKPMFRIRAIGYDSRKEAKTWVALLEDRLGVDSAWVSKR